MVFRCKYTSIQIYWLIFGDQKIHLYLKPVQLIVGNSVELPKWLKSGSGTKKSAKGKFLWPGGGGHLVLPPIRVPNVWNVSMHYVLCC